METAIWSLWFALTLLQNLSLSKKNPRRLLAKLRAPQKSKLVTLCNVLALKFNIKHIGTIIKHNRSCEQA